MSFTPTATHYKRGRKLRWHVKPYNCCVLANQSMPLLPKSISSEEMSKQFCRYFSLAPSCAASCHTMATWTYRSRTNTARSRDVSWRFQVFANFRNRRRRRCSRTCSTAFLPFRSLRRTACCDPLLHFGQGHGGDIS